MATTFTKYRLILIALTACCLAYFSFTLPMIMNENKRILSVNVNNCGQVKECPEGEEAYFRTYPDVAKHRFFQGRTAYLHWKLYGKEEGRHYICSCPKILSVRHFKFPVSKVLFQL